MDVLQRLRNETPPRMEPLAKLPVFWSLEGKRVVVAGGTDAAAWKAELLAACGASVDIYAEALGEALANLLAREPMHLGASFTLHSRCVAAADLEGATLAVGDCSDEGAARAFWFAARAAGVPVNVIDKPEYCQFQFGSIVNRSPVVVAISTDGAAPVLAQSIRRKIETLLPRSLKAWAALAQSLRGEVNRRLKSSAQRRAFWERFSDRVFSTFDTPEEGVGGALLADAERLAEAPATGRVTLVGAGPGDPELVTLKAVRALQTADVILFDDFVSAEVLELARREAKRVAVHMHGGGASGRDDKIEARMLKLAHAGNRVVRLTSGDPTAFGRLVEDLASLRKYGVAVEIVPGVTVTSTPTSGRGLSLPFGDQNGPLSAVGRRSGYSLPEQRLGGAVVKELSQTSA
ncbi:siroheme synthase family protein [Ensifer sp. MJa1]|uniref:siroheme synthase family protein n=1 Tax=Ensifer sp. MJa1 TaxID=2919888 RepID=UPI00300879C1